jgi:RHS repeat-associated protein
VLAKRGDILSEDVRTGIEPQVSKVRQSEHRPSRDVYSNSAWSSGRQGPNAVSRRQAFDENGNSVWFIARTVYDFFGRAVVSTEEYPEGTSEPIRGTQTVYDPRGRTIRSIQLSGVVVAIDSVTGNSTLTSSGTIVSQNQTTYNADGRVAFTTDAYGLETHTTLDSLGRTTETRRQAVDQNGSIVWLVSRTVFDSQGRVDISTDEYQEGSPGPIYGTRSIYDELGRTVQTVRLEGVSISINSVTGNSTLTAQGTSLWQTETMYNDDGTVFKQIAADGQITEYEYDAFRRQVAMIGTPVVINGQTVRLRSETVYDGQGRTRQQRTNITQFPNGTIDATDVQTTTFDYDSRGNIIKTTYADGTFVALAYDDLGRKISETNQMNLTRTFTYDSQGRLASVTLPDQDGNPATTNDIATYGYKYDARGNMVQLTDPLGRDTRFRFNNQGQQLSRTLPLGFGTDGMFGTADDPAVGQASSLPFTEHAQYDAKGRKILETSFEGVVTEYLYDDAFHGTGRLYQKKFYASEAAFNAGTVKETQTITFDAFGREISTQWTSTGEPGGVSPRSDVWTNQYDVQGRLLSVASPTGTVFYEYDVFGRQTRVMSRGAGFQPANATDYETDIRYSYDSLGRLKKVETFERNNVALDIDPVTAGNQPEAESYAYDLLGNLDYEINPDGSTTDYTYDELNRLTDLDEYRASTTTPSVFTDNPKLAEYNYTLRADGKNESADEIIYATNGTTPVSHTQFDWTYDNASRLTDEVFTDVGNLMADVDNYHTAFEYDLTGNRLTQTTITDTNHDGVLNAAVDRDEVTTYTSDANDRMLSESTVVEGVATESTAYGYTGTQQTSKVVTPAGSGSPLSAVSFTYDLQGRIFQATTETFNAGTLTSRNRASYQYGTDGIRFSARSETDTVLNLTTANWQLTTDTKYLIDANNHTGYQQVLQETVTDANGNLIKKIVYTIGLDHISQTTFSTGGPAQGETAVFHMDGHGSTRILTDLAGTILNIAGFAQIYHYTAYGEAINFQMSSAATQYLYSGEQFDARIGQQYLRARYYDQSTGTFNRLDPFFGNQTDPQSFHKYLYTHGDSVNGIDPTGLYTALGVAIGTGIVGALAGGTISYINGGSVLGGAAIGFGVGFSLGYLGGAIALHGARFVLGKLLSAVFLGPGKFPFVAAGGSVANILTLLWRVGTIGGAAIEGFLFFETMWKGYQDGESFRHSVDHFLAINPWAIKPEPGLLGATSISGPQGVIQRYKHIINGQQAVPPELLASVLLAELQHYNVSDTVMDTFMIGSDPSIGITQIRVGTVVDRGYAPGLNREQIADLLFHPGSAIQLLAADLKHVADTKGIDLAGWDSLPLSDKKILIEGFTRTKDLINPNDWFHPENGFGGLGPWGVSAYSDIRTNGLLQ